MKVCTENKKCWLILPPWKAQKRRRRSRRIEFFKYLISSSDMKFCRKVACLLQSSRLPIDWSLNGLHISWGMDINKRVAPSTLFIATKLETSNTMLGNKYSRDHCLLGQTFNTLSPPPFLMCLLTKSIYFCTIRMIQLWHCWEIDCSMSINNFFHCYKKHLKCGDEVMKNYKVLY